MKIYDKDGDIPISAGSPSESASVTSSVADGINRSRTTSPATVSTTSLNTPPERTQPPFGYISPQQPVFTSHPSAGSIYQSSPPPQGHYSTQPSPSQAPRQPVIDTSPKYQSDPILHMNYDPASQFNPLPATFSDLPNWNPNFSLPQQETYSMPPVSHALTSPIYNESYAASNGYPITDYLYPPSWSMDARTIGLNQAQQVELMQRLELNETAKIEAMIQQSNAIFSPQVQNY